MRSRHAFALLLAVAILSISARGADPGAKRRADIAHDTATKANRRIEFYGQVVDQSGVPVAEATVDLSVRWTAEPVVGDTEDLVKNVKAKTDAQGKFVVKGMSGSLLTIDAITKPGYEAPDPIGGGYWYSTYAGNELFTPHADQPEILKIWKLSGAEKVIAKDMAAQVAYGADPVCFDLVKGKTAKTGGDLCVAVQRQAPVAGQDRYAWSVALRAPSGGLIVTSDKFLYRAPATGYQSELTLETTADQPNWSPVRTVSVYLKTRNGGAFARAVIDIGTSADSRPWCAVSVRSFLNPSGSTNLEYNPNQDIDVRP